MGLHRVLPALRVIAPDAVQQLVAGEDLSGVGQELIEQLKLLPGQLQGLPLPLHRVGAGVQHHTPHHDFLLAGDAGATEEGIDPPGELLIIHRLGHIVVNAGGKSLPLVLKGLLGGEQQHGDGVPPLPQGLHQGVPVHPGHHHVGDDQVHRPALQHLQRLHAVSGAHHVEPVLQFGGGEQAHGVVVLHQQNGRHAAPPLPPGRPCPPKKSFWTFPTAGVILYLE